MGTRDKSKVPSSSIPQQVPIITKRSYCQISLPRDVSHAELVDILKTNSAVVVDVRTPQELSRHGDIPGAINIPLGDLETALSMRPKKFETLFHVSVTDRTPLVFSCMAGIRSKKAAA